MSVDKFGRYTRKQPLSSGSFPTTANGDYDVQHKHLRNIKDPVSNGDAATKGFVLKEIANKRSLELGKDDAYDAKNKRVCNVAPPKNKDDAATKSFVQDSYKKQFSSMNNIISNQKTELGNFKERITKCENKIESNNAFYDNYLRKFGTFLFNYINKKPTSRTADFPTLDEILDLFQIPQTKEEETEEPIIHEISLPEDIRKTIMGGSKKN